MILFKTLSNNKYILYIFTNEMLLLQICSITVCCFMNIVHISDLIKMTIKHSIYYKKQRNNIINNTLY